MTTGCNCTLCVEFFGRPDAPPRDAVYERQLDWCTCGTCGRVWTRRAWPVCPDCNQIDPSADTVQFMNEARARVESLFDWPRVSTPAADLMDEPYRKIVRPE